MAEDLESKSQRLSSLPICAKPFLMRGIKVMWRSELAVRCGKGNGGQVSLSSMISRHIVDLGDTVACPERHPAPTLVTEPRARLHLIAFARAGGACDRIALCGPTSVMALALLMEWRAVDLVVHKRESSTPSIVMSPDPRKSVRVTREGRHILCR
jgi:hypothetical protein